MSFLQSCAQLPTKLARKHLKKNASRIEEVPYDHSRAPMKLKPPHGIKKPSRKAQCTGLKLRLYWPDAHASKQAGKASLKRADPAPGTPKTGLKINLSCCQATSVRKPKSALSTNPEPKLRITWNRDRAIARILWQNLTQINDLNQQILHLDSRGDEAGFKEYRQSALSVGLEVAGFLRALRRRAPCGRVRRDCRGRAGRVIQSKLFRSCCGLK